MQTRLSSALIIFGTLSYTNSLDFRSIEATLQELIHTVGMQLSPHCLFTVPGEIYQRQYWQPTGTRTQSCTCISFGKADCQPGNMNMTSSTTSVPTETTETVNPTTPKLPVPHPLDPLTALEILQTRTVILSAPSNLKRAKIPGPRYMFPSITLKEPPKAILLPYFLSNTNAPISVYPRKSVSVLLERGTGKSFEAVVNLNTKTQESFTELPSGIQFTIEEIRKAQNIVKLNPEVQKRCRMLGYHNMSLVHPDPSPISYVGDRPEFIGRRLFQMYLFGREFEGDNFYPHPFDFLVIVDMIEEKFIGIEELPTHDDFNATTKDGTTVPRTSNNYDPALLPSNFFRTDDKPVETNSPNGPSFTVDGYEIKWQKFKFRFGFNGREGLVIYNVNYNDSGSVRPILYRATTSEVWTSYGDPRPPYHRKSAFDQGEFGLGYAANEMKPNVDCSNAKGQKLFDIVLNNFTGHPKIIKNAICVNEDDAGILWKHLDTSTGKTFTVRSHRLVLSFIITLGNYDFIFFWRFYQDGSIEYKVQLTGILNINLLAVNATPGGYGNTVFPQNNAQYHQHFFTVRLDTDIDGYQNSVHSSEVFLLKGKTGSDTNPYGQGFTTNITNLKTTSAARTHISPLTSKVWVVTNPNKIHPYTKKPVGWKLIPMNLPPLIMMEDSPLHPRVKYLDFDVWVTRYDDDQFLAGGLWLNNSGLPEWVTRDPNASVDSTDVVIWHNFGIIHIPRVEDYPVMPVVNLRFWFKPYNFFSGNPGLDVPLPSDSGA